MDTKDALCALCEKKLEERPDTIKVSVARAVKKYTYELPSGRKVKVVAYDESELVRKAA